MSDYESRREDAKREAYEDAHFYGDCPVCGGKMYTVEDWPSTMVDPASGRAECSECAEEVEW